MLTATVTLRHAPSRMYNKLFSKIVRSSIWLEPTPTRLIWVMFIAMMDEDGFVELASPANVAHVARLEEEETRKALLALEAPDPNSANPEHEGRRLERVPGGWIVLNACLYRGLVTREMAREQTRIRSANYRKRHAASRKITKRHAPVTTSEAEAYKKKISVSNETSGQPAAKAETNKNGCSLQKAEEIRMAYPLKVQKPRALRAIMKALQKHPADFLLERTRLFTDMLDGRTEFVAHPATWFNGDTYNDDPSTWIREDSATPPKREGPLPEWEVALIKQRDKEQRKPYRQSDH